MQTSLQAFVKRFFVQILPTQSQRIFRFLGFSGFSVESPDPQGFDDKTDHLYLLLQDHELSSKVIVSGLKDLIRCYPLPPVELVSSDIWPNDGPSVTVKTHLRSTLSDATKLLENTGRTLSAEGEKHLKLLLTHPCGWSATYIEHMNDSWVEFFHVRHPSLNLVPILDSMTYAEEVERLPDGLNPVRPQFFLLANSDSYFIYDNTDTVEALFRAGNTLEEVYMGMRDWRWAEVSDNMWEVVIGYNIPSSEYIPIYNLTEEGILTKFISK
jgi:hypothetical protein